MVSVMEGRNPALLRVAYGTSQKPLPDTVGCFLLKDPKYLKLAGLRNATRYNMKNLVLLPWTLGAFLNSPGGTGVSMPSPIIGALHSGC